MSCVGRGSGWPVYEGGRGLLVTKRGMEIADVAARKEVWRWCVNRMLLS